MVDNLFIIANIALKDIRDAIKNRFVVYQIIVVTLILVSIKGLGLIIQPPETQIIVYDPSGSSLSEMLQDSPAFSVFPAASFDELQQSISNMGFGLGAELGLVIPPDFDDQIETTGQADISGYISWANRAKIAGIRTETESALETLPFDPVDVNLDINIITPPAEIGLLVGIVTIFAVTIILTVGIILVPALMIEEKQNRTLDALLVSPASIGQIVAGKALAGCFYILVTTMIVYIVYWSGVYNWWVALLFVVGALMFAVSVGLLFGVLFDRQEEMTGWLSLSLVLISGSILIELIDLDLPVFLERLLPWMPPVALAKIFWASFSSSVDYHLILNSLGVVFLVSGLIFGFIVFRIKQLDR